MCILIRHTFYESLVKLYTKNLNLARNIISILHSGGPHEGTRALKPIGYVICYIIGYVIGH